MPENTVSVTRPGKWGNPFHVVKFGRQWFVHDSLSDQHSRPFKTKQAAATEAVSLFRYVLERKHRENLGEFLAPLKGKNLACFCSLGDPCHADVLLDLANATDHLEAGEENETIKQKGDRMKETMSRERKQNKPEAAALRRVREQPTTEDRAMSDGQTKQDGLGAGFSTSLSKALLDVPPSNGYSATVHLRWVRSAKHGGTVLAQKYTSAYMGEEDVWCPVPHGLPDTSNTKLNIGDKPYDAATVGKEDK